MMRCQAADFRKGWLSLVTVFTVFTLPVYAVEQKLPASAAISSNPVGADQLATVTLGLLVVLALIFGLAWLFRRYGNLATFNRSNIQILGGVSLGPREKAVLLEVEGERLLVGVASGQVSRLHIFPRNKPGAADARDPANETAGQDTSADSFATTLQHEKRDADGGLS